MSESSRSFHTIPAVEDVLRGLEGHYTQKELLEVATILAESHRGQGDRLFRVAYAIAEPANAYEGLYRDYFAGKISIDAFHSETQRRSDRPVDAEMLAAVYSGYEARVSEYAKFADETRQQAGALILGSQPFWDIEPLERLAASSKAAMSCTGREFEAVVRYANEVRVMHNLGLARAGIFSEASAVYLASRMTLQPRALTDRLTGRVAGSISVREILATLKGDQFPRADAVQALLYQEHAAALRVLGADRDRADAARRPVLSVEKLVVETKHCDIATETAAVAAGSVTVTAAALTREDGVGREPTGPENVFRREGDFWTVAFGKDSCILDDALGCWYIAQLIGNPGIAIAAADLYSGRNGPDGPTAAIGLACLDEAARAAYREEYRRIQSRIDAAERDGDQVARNRLLDERKALAAELAASTGLGGSIRETGGTNANARSAVRNALNRVFESLSDQKMGDLADHLDLSISCERAEYMYDPRPAVFWNC